MATINKGENDKGVLKMQKTNDKLSFFLFPVQLFKAFFELLPINCNVTERCLNKVRLHQLGNIWKFSPDVPINDIDELLLIQTETKLLMNFLRYSWCLKWAILKSRRSNFLFFKLHLRMVYSEGMMQSKILCKIRSNYLWKTASGREISLEVVL